MYCEKCHKEMLVPSPMDNICINCYENITTQKEIKRENKKKHTQENKSYLLVILLTMFSILIIIMGTSIISKKSNINTNNIGTIENTNTSTTTNIDTDTSNSQSTSSNSTNSTSSSSKLDYCEAYGCIRKEAYEGANYCSTHLVDKDAETPVAGSDSNSYSKYHRCEYSGCSNYASGTKYCSKHNTTLCSKLFCTNREAYQGAGLCTKHLYESIQNYGK